jgi:hypothetical protein
LGDQTAVEIDRFSVHSHAATTRARTRASTNSPASPTSSITTF